MKTATFDQLNATGGAISLLTRYRLPIMGFAALWIVIFHEWRCLFYGIPKLGGLENFIKTIGFCGVDIFLLMSGIGLTFAIQKGIPTFYLRRLKRVFFPFFLVAILYAVLERWSFRELIGVVSGYDFYAKDIYTFFWFVPAILTLYFLFPLYDRLFRIKPTVVFLGSLALWLLITLLFGQTMRYDLFGFTNRIPVFLFGIYFGRLSQIGKVRETPFLWIAAGLLLITGLCLSYYTNFMDGYFVVPASNCCIPPLCITLSLPLLMAKGLDLLRYRNPGGRLYRWILGFFAFYGEISFEVYLLQQKSAALILGLLQIEDIPILSNVVTLLFVTFVAFIFSILLSALQLLMKMTVKKIVSRRRNTAIN